MEPKKEVAPIVDLRDWKYQYSPPKMTILLHARLAVLLFLRLRELRYLGSQIHRWLYASSYFQTTLIQASAGLPSHCGYCYASLVAGVNVVGGAGTMHRLSAAIGHFLALHYCGSNKGTNPKAQSSMSSYLHSAQHREVTLKDRAASSEALNVRFHAAWWGQIQGDQVKMYLMLFTHRSAPIEQHWK